MGLSKEDFTFTVKPSGHSFLLEKKRGVFKTKIYDLRFGHLILAASSLHSSLPPPERVKNEIESERPEEERSKNSIVRCLFLSKDGKIDF